MWVKIDDRLPAHPKIQLLSDGAFRLYVSAICWCNAHLTDGIVPTQHLCHVATIRRPRTRADELVLAGLWEPVDGGWRIHDYLEYQPSSGDIAKRRDQKRERQHRWLRHKDPPGDTSQDAPSDPPPDPPRDTSADAPEDAAATRARAFPNPNIYKSPIPTGTGGRARAPARDGTRAQERILIETIQGAISNRTGVVVSDSQALDIAARFKDDHPEMRNPVTYISAAIMREPRPQALLPAAARTRQPPPRWRPQPPRPDQPAVNERGAAAARAMLAARSQPPPAPDDDDGLPF